MKRRSLPLAARTVFATGLVGVLVGSVFVVMLLAVSALREAERREARSRDVTVSTLALEKLVLDMQAGVRGFVITGDKRFQTPLITAQRELPQTLDELQRLVAESPSQRKRVRLLGQEIRDYRDVYAIPIVNIAETNRAAAGSPAAVAEDKRLIDSIRMKFSHLLDAEEGLASQSAQSADERWTAALVLGIGGLIALAAAMLAFGVYLARSIARPVREVAGAATRLADGHLEERLNEGGPGEIGDLTRAFNAMAENLQRSRQELEAQNEQLRESERMKSELVSIVSHELRTPLASVLGFTSLLLTRDFDEETRHRYLGIIDAQARRLGALIDDFLDARRLEQGRLELGRDRVEVAPLLREQAELFRGQSERHRLTVEVPRKPLAVRGDRDRLAQVIGNLLSNAIKYSPEGGVVELVGEDDDGVIRVAVRDQGVGIPDDQQSQIFTRFFRGDAAASGIGGTGLGLAVSREIVEAHGGRIGFNSAEREGSTFWVELPAADRRKKENG
ncbi:MAG TPA: ATP-binding protein [Gaiellaceae bacterium]|nr:ATP-binding protein [Gaiellaceae bacterium]